ncbi:M15 family metallopeptidase [Microbacterium sp. NPDC089698]|jgi:zinc D-Ala-D-Ala carboxypeptidase|uniref:M15 family metallopeptidase n=1 Tax=Microbacterium sp. NPDC089698 TaxID=3364200 RepID=UPI0038262EEA
MDTNTTAPLRPGSAPEWILHRDADGDRARTAVPAPGPQHAKPRRRPRLFRIAVTLTVLATLGAGTAAAVITAAVASRPDYPGPVAAAGGDGSASARGGGMPTVEDGFLADGASVPLSDPVPAVTQLDPALRDALGQALAAAEEDGLELRVASGWRSKAYQAWLLRDAVRTYGSEAEAARWVGTPETSLHVKGQAVDIGPYDAADWLNRHGAQFGLCRTYDNEAWHFELSPSAIDQGCPPMFRDPTEDPRMKG